MLYLLNGLFVPSFQTIATCITCWGLNSGTQSLVTVENGPTSCTWSLLSEHKKVPGSKLWQRITKAWKKMLPSLTSKRPTTRDSASSNQSLWFSTSFSGGFTPERAAELASSGMCLLRDIWNPQEADFKPLDLLEREFGLKEDEFDRFSFLADHISEQYAHLLLQDPDSIVIGDWIGAFCNDETPRPTFLFQTSQSFCPDSILDFNLHHWRFRSL